MKIKNNTTGAILRCDRCGARVKSHLHKTGDRCPVDDGSGFGCRGHIRAYDPDTADIVNMLDRAGYRVKSITLSKGTDLDRITDIQFHCRCDFPCRPKGFSVEPDIDPFSDSREPTRIIKVYTDVSTPGFAGELEADRVALYAWACKLLERPNLFR